MTQKKKDEGTLYIGMDLGTSRTAVASSSGVRESMATCIGYPRDVVAEKLLNGRKVVYGAEAIQLRTSLDFHMPLAHGVIKTGDDEFRAAKDIVRHAIEMVRPRKGEVTYCVIGAPAVASDKNKRLLVDAVKDLVDSVLICSEPFSVAYGLDRLDEALVIDIGAGTVDLCRMHGTLPDPDDQMTLDSGGDAVDAKLFELMQKSCAKAQFNLHMVKRIKEQYATLEDPGKNIMVTLPVDGRPTEFDLGKDIREACLSIVPPMVEALRKLIATFEPDLQHRLRNNVLLGGGGSQIRGLDRALEEAMDELGGGTVNRVEEPLYAGANGALKIAQDMPEEHWERLT
jgi:rod shape-determining protein MreB